MTYNSNERLARYQTIAADAHARGFTSEAKRKEALDFVNRAYEIARDVFGDTLRKQFPWDEAARSWPAAYLAISDVAPFGLHQWRAKHAQALAGYPDFVAKVESLVALREGIKGVELQAKQPRPKTAKEIAKEAAQMTCQICGRAIFAERGRIAHHGYERPGTGWQTASCEGALKLPFEASNEALLAHIVRIGAHIVETQLQLGETQAETRAVPYRYYSKERARQNARFGAKLQKTIWVTRLDFDAKLAEIADDRAYRGDGIGDTFDRAKDYRVRALQGELQASRDYQRLQTDRAKAWKATHRAGGAGERAWVAL